MIGICNADGKVAMATTTFLSFVMLQTLISTILPTDTEEMPVLGACACLT